MQPGQFLVSKDGEKRKILEVLNNLIAIENPYNLPGFVWMKKNEALTDGWSLLEEPWKPTLSEPYWYVNEDGNFGTTNWGIDGMEEHDFRYAIGNVHQNLSEAKLYKQKLIDRMGRKE